ncbi:MAG: phytoene desaturase family protein, partial [Acidimicrobiia bacterium]
MRDVVVVGAGHNALVAACYLARAGLEVEVVERDTVLGGACSTVARWPGYRVDRGSSAHVMVRHTGVVEELDLAAYGLEYQDLDPWGFAPFWTDAGEQVALTFWVDLDRTCDSIAALCGPADADAYRRFVADWGARSARVFDAFAG